MENKLTSEERKVITGLKEEIRRLQKQIDEKEIEINRVLVKAAADFEGSYIEYYDGEEYIFMKVERQIIRDGGSKINLQGPAIRLEDSPLNKDYEEDEEFGMGSYDEYDGFSFGPKVLQGLTVERIRKITRDDMVFVLDHYIDAMKKNLI